MPDKQPPKPDNRTIELEKIKEQVQYGKVMIWATGFIVLGAIFYHQVEKLSWLDSFYFTVITLSTVGYGDIVPKTPAGKLFTIFYVLVGITIFIVLARLILSGLVLRHSKRK